MLNPEIILRIRWRFLANPQIVLQVEAIIISGITDRDSDEINIDHSLSSSSFLPERPRSVDALLSSS